MPRRKSSFQICEEKTIAFHDFSQLNWNRGAKHWASIDEGMKLAVFAAGIDRWRKISQEVVIEFAACELVRQNLGVDASDLGAESSGDHVVRQLASRELPHWEQ